MACKKSVKEQSIKAIILVGSRDFGRCPLTSELPAALWPVLGKPVLERLLTSLADQGIRQAAICSNDNGSQLAKLIHADNRLELKYLDEPLPAGTAGCIRDAADDETDALYLVFSAGIRRCQIWQHVFGLSQGQIVDYRTGL